MNQKKILIVDDDPFLLLGLSRRLRANSYDVDCAGDGVSALAGAKHDKPDLILLDIGMPGQDGFKVLERLKADDNLCSIPVILLSGRAARSNRERALSGGALDYLQKPAENLQLLSAVQLALES